MKYYEDCRLEISWWNRAVPQDISGSFTSDPATVVAVWDLLLASPVNFKVRVTGHEGNLNLAQARQIAQLQKKFEEALTWG